MKNLQLVFATIIILLVGCSQNSSPAKRYQSKFAKPSEHPAWLKRHSGFMGGLFKRDKDWRISVAENQIKAIEIRKAKAEKEEKVLNEILKIKSKMK